MAYNWEKYKNFAEFILNVDGQIVDEETKIRNAVSRLFYHAFHCLENWAIKSLSYESTENNTHGSLKAHLLRCKHKDKAELYKQLRDIRSICDYDNETSADLKQLFARAKIIHDRLVGPLKNFSSLEK